MINNFRDHAANERTFLAWVRTAIAIMAFGFVIEKFDLFLVIAAQTLSSHHVQLRTNGFANIAGLMLIILGVVIVTVGAARLMFTARKIDAPTVYPGTGERVDIALAALLGLLGLAMFFYLSRGILVSY